jgi:hypothetical protein
MTILETMRQIKQAIGGDAVVKLEIGDYESGPLDFLGDEQSRLIIIKDKAFLTWTVDDSEWLDPSDLIEQVTTETPEMLKTHNYYLEHPDELMAELAKKVNTQ